MSVKMLSHTGHGISKCPKKTPCKSSCLCIAFKDEILCKAIKWLHAVFGKFKTSFCFTDYLNVYSSSTCRATQRLELKGVQAYSELEGLEGLHTLPTAVVDYRGVRLSAQGLAPGLEGSEQDQETTPASRYTLWT